MLALARAGSARRIMRLRVMVPMILALTAILAVWSGSCAAETVPGPGDLLTGILTSAWYLPLVAPELVAGPLAVWPGPCPATGAGSLVFSSGAWAPEGTKGTSWSRGLELIRGTGGGDYDFLAGISRAWGVRDLAIPSARPARFGLTQAELGLARGWSEDGERVGEIRTIREWVAEVALPVGSLSFGARAHVLDGSLEDHFISKAGEDTRLRARGLGYALDLAMTAPITVSFLQETAVEVAMVNMLGGIAWNGSLTSDGTTRPWNRDEKVLPGVALSFEVRPSSRTRVRSIRITLESSGGGGPWGAVGAPYASPWRMGLGTQLEVAPGFLGTGSISLYPDRSPSAAAGARLRLGRVSTDVALAFDDRLSVASRVMVTGRITF